MRRVSKKSVKWKKPPITQEATTINASLPPSVEGQTTGRLCVQLLQIKWDFDIPPPAPRLHVRLKWWGEAGAGTIFKVPVVSSVQSKRTAQPSASAFYDIKASWKKMGAYLNDMGSLILDVGLGDVSNEAMLIGQTVVKHVGRLRVTTPIEEFCEIANADGIILGKMWVKLSMSAVKKEVGQQKLQSLEGSCKEFVVGPAVRRQSPITKQTSKIHREEFVDNVIVSNSPIDETPKVIPTVKSSASKEMISLLLDRSKRLRDAMINSILDTENTIKEAEVLCDNIEASQFHRSEDFSVATEFLCDQDPNRSFVEQSLHANDGDNGELASNDRIVDLVLKGHRVNTCCKNHNLDHPLSSDEDKTLDDSILTDSSGPMHNEKLLQELLYSRDKDKSEESSVVLPAAAAFDSDSTESSHSPIVEDKEDIQKLTDSNEKQTVHLASVPVSKRSVKHSAIHKGFGKQGEMREKNILSGIGLDRLTKLGRVNAAKVLVGHVAITDPSSSSHDSKPTRGTYFVEYRFPVVSSGDTHKCTEYEVTRVASKKILNQCIAFSHRSLFPLAFNSQVIRRWWNGMLFFRLYHRNPSERMPQLIGRARLPLRQVLRASQFCLDCELGIHSMNLQQAVDQTVEEEEDTAHKIGTIKVHVELLPSFGKVNKDAKFDSSLETAASGSDVEVEEQMIESELGPVAESKSKLRNDDGSDPPLLQMLLMIPNGFNITLPSSRPDASKEVPPNSYLICKIFCCHPYPKTQPIWNSSNPIFSFRQTFPLRLSKSLLLKMCNSFMIVEVWHKTAGNVPDILVGLVKIGLHQFFLAFSDEDTLPSLMKSDYPVVAMDSYCPIVDPISAKTHGHLAVLLALGNLTQISCITKEFSSGNYIIHRPHQSYNSPHCHTKPAQSYSSDHACQKNDNSKDAVSNHGSIETMHQHTQHVFEVVIEGVRDLSLFTNTIWGEADCFVQYHFPKQLQQLGEDEGQQGKPILSNSINDIELHPHRTNTALCTPDPSFSHETKHILTLPADTPVQKTLMSCYRAGGMGIELWKRFYYPNIRDQLVAKATLPTAKLCAVVTMRRAVTASIQSFSLPLALTLKDSQTDNGGLVDLTIKYYDVKGGHSLMTKSLSATDGELQNQVTISVGILRATGLKDAALNACKDNPVSMAFAAEVGVNAYAKLKLPLLSAKNEYSTKTIARSFSPEFSHFFDITLPVKLDDCGHTSMVTSLAERLEHSSVVLEVWHCMPKHQKTTMTSSSSDGSHTTHAVFGRCMGGALHDVLLGSMEVPLSPLLVRHTGINGWFPLNICSNGYTTLPTAEQQCNSSCVGGVEININFTSAEDRTAILQSGAKLGWSPSVKGIGINSQTGDAMASWETDLQFEMQIEGVLLPAETVAIPTSVKEKYKLCYVRYKFYDRAPVVSKVFSITSLRENKAFYKVFHTSSTQLTNTESLKWYLLEECLEVQLWLCESVRDHGNRPNSRDTLVGTASIPLLPLACIGGHSDVVTIKDSFVLFKAGLNSLNGQCIYIKITNSAVSEGYHSSTAQADKNKNMTVQESDGFASDYQSSAPSECQDTSSSSSTVVTSKEQKGVELRPVSLEEMFQANVIIHEAMHLCLPNGFQDNDVHYCYVTAQPHPGIDKIITSTVECNTHHIVWETQALTHIPLKFFSKQHGGLQFHLWYKGVGGREERIGIVHLDLTPLASGLRQQLCGWYHIVDHTGQPKGQMRLSVAPTSRLGLSKSSLLLSTKNTSPTAATTSDHEAFSDVPNSCTSSFLVNHLRQNISELDLIHKNLEARLEQLETRTSHVHHLTGQQNHQHQDTKYLTDDQKNHQSLHLVQSSQDLHQNLCIEHGNQILHIDPPMNNDSTLTDQSRHDHHPIHSKTMISSHEQEPVSSYTISHIQHSREQSTTNSSVDYSSSDDESSSILSNASEDNEMEPPSSTVQCYANNTAEGTGDTVIPKSTGSNSSSVLSDSCVSDSDDERSSVEDDGQSYHGDRVVTTLNSVVSHDQDDQQKMHVSFASNLTTITPTELSSLSDDESNGHQSSLGEDNREQVEIEMVTNSESSEELETSTSIVTQSLLNKDETMKEQQYQCETDNLGDIASGLSHPPPAIIHQEDEQTSLTLPPSCSPVHKTPPVRFGLGNIPPKIQLPNFFMPPQELEQTMRRLKMTALTRPPPREFDHVSVTSEKQKMTQSRMVEEKTRQNLSLQDMQRVARIFASKPS